jgi:hypothetical protein
MIIRRCAHPDCLPLRMVFGLCHKAVELAAHAAHSGQEARSALGTESIQ